MNDSAEELVHGGDQGAGALLSRGPLGAREAADDRPAAPTVSVIDGQCSALAPNQGAIDYAERRTLQGAIPVSG